MGPEKKFENEVKKWLDALTDTWYFKVHGNGVQSSGIPDIIACVNGDFVALEIKSEVGKLSELQKSKLKRLYEVGGLVYVVKPSNFESVKAGIKCLISKDYDLVWANNETHLCAMGVLDV